MKKDKYDLQIERLTEKPELIQEEWFEGKVLFKWVGNGLQCGCLTQIRYNVFFYAINPKGEIDQELTEEIRKDELIPIGIAYVTIEDLPVFAEWQRKIDKRYNRKP
jgi:hypothetical protein